MNPHDEFQRQINNLRKLNYLRLLGLTEGEFSNLTSVLEIKLKTENLYSIDFDTGKLPFVIVVKSDLAPAEKTMPLVNKNGKEGIVKLFPHTSKNFSTIKQVTLPTNVVYIVKNIDRGKKNINLPPSEALKQINSEMRTPLTIDEGIAIVTHFPEFLLRNNCFSLLASRNDTDKRVPAIWINSKNNPNLGWCWDGNPHTWLGSASCEKRIGI